MIKLKGGNVVEIVSVKEASLILGVSTSRVYKLIQDKIIKLYKGMPRKDSVEGYLINRNPIGRPTGIK